MSTFCGFQGMFDFSSGEKMEDSFIKISFRTAYEITACFCSCNAAVKIVLWTTEIMALLTSAVSSLPNTMSDVLQENGKLGQSDLPVLTTS